MKSLSVLVPAFNEEGNIEITVREIMGALKNLSVESELLVMDDGSQDMTYNILKKLKEEYPSLNLLHHEKNLGIGKSLTDLFTVAKNEFVLFFPADRQYSASEIPLYIKALESNDIVIGRRIKRMDPFHRKLTSYIFNLIVSLLARKRIHDVDSTKLIRRSLFQKFVFNAKKSSFVDAELCINSARAGYSIVEIPVTHYPRTKGKARGATPMTVFKTIKDLVKFSMNLKKK